MRIEQLEYLIEIAKTNSISIAAENPLCQSAVDQ